MPTPPSSIQHSITAHIPSSTQHSVDAHAPFKHPAQHHSSHPFKHPAQRRCPNSPCKQAQTQPLQSSSAALTTHNLSSNGIFSRWKHQPRKGMLSGSASAGGELILGRRESALFFKSPLSERLQDASSDFCKTLLADSRQPRSQPPTKPQPGKKPLTGVPFRHITTSV